MRFDLHFRDYVSKQIDDVVQQMASWQHAHTLSAQEEADILGSIHPFNHTSRREDLVVGGVDGSGDFPALTYEDSFVYLSVAQATSYEAVASTGLHEVTPAPEPLVDFTWLPADKDQCRSSFMESFERLGGEPVPDVVGGSDYREIKASRRGKPDAVGDLVDQLILPDASQTGNVAIQLRTCAELGAALRLFRSKRPPKYVLLDSTMSLPLVTRKTASLYFEHLKRFCCVEARRREIGFFALSKSHGLPASELINELARRKLGVAATETPEHWFIRLPVPGHDGWKLPLLENRQIPPVGAVSYLVRFYRSVPIMRLDMDYKFWEDFVRGPDEEATQLREKVVFEDLDYVSHDQRVYGYPYPVKAAHDRVSMTEAERVALRTQVIDAAVKAGMKRSLFQSVSRATGHG